MSIWAVGIFVTDENNVYTQTVEIPKFMEGREIQELLKVADEKSGSADLRHGSLIRVFTPEQRQEIEEAANKKIRDIKAAKEFRDLCLIAVKRLGKKSSKTDNWRLFRGPLIISYFPNRSQLGTLSVIQEKTLIWDGIDDKPVADFSDAANIVKGWLRK